VKWNSHGVLYSAEGITQGKSFCGGGLCARQMTANNSHESAGGG
ncbi:MAG: hypothetical protein ACI9IN_001709, partial [Porticoccaceae bacterium]